MEEIKIYAPVSGEIKSIEKISDPVFAEKMLGDGFFIEPNSKKFFSPFEKGEVIDIFDTKHAFYIKAEQGPIILMHIGLDTVKLAGTPFDVKVTKGQSINLQTEIVDVKLTEIKKNKLSVSSPIVLNSYDNPGWTITNIKTGVVKQGDEIATLCYQEPKVETINEDISNKKLFNLKDALTSGLRHKNRYEEIAGKIYDYVGGKNNYDRYYNCVTRLRFIIKDKTLVDDSMIKNIDVVKGVNWNGSEIQIIIGGEVEKVKDGLDKYLIYLQEALNFNLKQGDKQKLNLGKKLLNLIKGIIIPAIPVMIGVGLINAVQAMLQQTGAIQNVSPSANFVNYTLATQLIYLIAGGASLFMGIFFTYNGVKYFGGSPLIGVVMGLILTAPIIFKGTLSYNVVTGAMSANPWSLPLITSKIDGQTFVWMKIGPTPGSIITSTIVAYIVVQAEKFAKRTYPNWSLMLTVSTSTIFIGAVATFFVVGPIISILEAAIGYIFSLISQVPFGLSIPILAFFWQILVLTGAHAAVVTIFQMPVLSDPDPYIQGLKSMPILVGITISVFAQAGASIGLLFVAKNANTKQTIIGGIPICIFGIPEPLIYGANLPKVKPFLFACTGAGVAGLVAGLMGANWYPGIKTGMGGILSVLAVNGPNGDTKSLIASLVGWAICFSLPALMVILFSKERVSEKIGLQIASKKFEKFIQSKNIIVDKAIEKEIHDLNAFYKNEQNVAKIKKFEKNHSKIQSLENKIMALDVKEGTRTERLTKRFERYKLKLQNGKNNEQIMMKLEQIINLLNTSKYSAKINELEAMLKREKDNTSELNGELDKITQANEEKVKLICDALNKEINSPLMEKIYNQFHNAINSVFINFGLVAPKNAKFSKIEKKELKVTK